MPTQFRGSHTVTITPFTEGGKKPTCWIMATAVCMMLAPWVCTAASAAAVWVTTATAATVWAAAAVWLC